MCYKHMERMTSIFLRVAGFLKIFLFSVYPDKYLKGDLKVIFNKNKYFRLCKTPSTLLVLTVIHVQAAIINRHIQPEN